MEASFFIGQIDDFRSFSFFLLFICQEVKEGEKGINKIYRHIAHLHRIKNVPAAALHLMYTHILKATKERWI